MWRFMLIGFLAILLIACLEVEGEVEITTDEEFEAFMNRQRCFFHQWEFCKCTEPGTGEEALFCVVHCEDIAPYFPEMTCPL